MTRIKAIDFVRQVKQEAKKLSLPTKKETLITSGVILAAVLIFAVFFILVDSAIMKLIQLILGLGR